MKDTSPGRRLLRLAWARVVTAAHTAWGRVIVMSLVRQSRVASCRHDGTGKGCYGCSIMMGFGGMLPQSAFDALPANCKLQQKPSETS